MLRFPAGRLRARGALAALGAGIVLTACAGSNLFEPRGAEVGVGGPSVEITVPTEGFTVNQGVSLQVEALVEAPAGLNTVTVKGVYKEAGNAAAFQPQSLTFQGANAADLNALLASTNAGPGAVYVIAEVTDQAGDVAADTVSITIN
jgi:hypothetical protein